MTAAGMIEQINYERPNQVEDYVKLEWLKKCEANLLDGVILLRVPLEGERSPEEWQEYLDTFNYDSELILKEPYDDLYVYFVDQRMGLNNNDMKRYNVATRLFDNMYLTFQQKYNREHLPVQKKKQIIKHEDI